MDAPQKKQLTSLLGELSEAVEQLLLAGLTAASKSTIERLDVSFKEAARMKLLRLGSTLRIANEEISRFTSGSPQFSARRLAFFLSRAWLLAGAMRRALDTNDDPALQKLLFTPPSQPLEKIHVVTLGISKRVVPGAFASFDFRLRCIAPASSDPCPVAHAEPLIWSCVFPMRKDLDLPAEAFLHLPQKQKFRPSLFLEKKTLEISRCAISRQPAGPTRLLLTDASEVKTLTPFSDWQPLWQWNIQDAAARLINLRPTPLDLEIELQEEIVLSEWSAAPAPKTDDAYEPLPIHTPLLPFEARLDLGPSGKPLTATMKKLAAAKTRPPLYGVAHYESCRLILQPLATLTKDGPDYLTISADKVSQAELVKAMKFT